MTLTAAQDFVQGHAPKPYYGDTYRGYEASYLPWLCDHLATQPPGRAVDVGPGWGTMAVFLRGLGWEVDVVDFLPVGTFIAPELLADTGIVYHQCAIETDTAFPDLQADLMMMTMVFGHLRYRPDIAIKNAKRLLAPGGEFLCCNLDRATNSHVACTYPDWRFMPVPGKKQPVSEDLVTCMFNEAEYRALLYACFKHVEIEARQLILYGCCRGW